MHLGEAAEKMEGAGGKQNKRDISWACLSAVNKGKHDYFLVYFLGTACALFGHGNAMRGSCARGLERSERVSARGLTTRFLFATLVCISNCLAHPLAALETSHRSFHEAGRAPPIRAWKRYPRVSRARSRAKREGERVGAAATMLFFWLWFAFSLFLAHRCVPGIFRCPIAYVNIM